MLDAAAGLHTLQHTSLLVHCTLVVVSHTCVVQGATCQRLLPSWGKTVLVCLRIPHVPVKVMLCGELCPYWLDMIVCCTSAHKMVNLGSVPCCFALALL
jgi:hypothetical protein